MANSYYHAIISKTNGADCEDLNTRIAERLRRFTNTPIECSLSWNHSQIDVRSRFDFRANQECPIHDVVRGLASTKGVRMLSIAALGKQNGQNDIVLSKNFDGLRDPYWFFQYDGMWLQIIGTELAHGRHKACHGIDSDRLHDYLEEWRRPILCRLGPCERENCLLMEPLINYLRNEPPYLHNRLLDILSLDVTSPLHIEGETATVRVEKSNQLLLIDAVENMTDLEAVSLWERKLKPHWRGSIDIITDRPSCVRGIRDSLSNPVPFSSRILVTVDSASSNEYEGAFGEHVRLFEISNDSEIIKCGLIENANSRFPNRCLDAIEMFMIEGRGPIKLYDPKKNWRKIKRQLGDLELNRVLVEDFNKYTFGRWGKPFLPGMKPADFEGCDWADYHIGRRPAFWTYVKHGACHWLVNFNLRLATLVEPNRKWRIITSDEHSSVWDGGDMLFDLQASAFGGNAASTFKAAGHYELAPGEYLPVELLRE